MPDLSAGAGIKLTKDSATDVVRISSTVVSGRIAFATYAELAAVTDKPVGTPAEVPTDDSGTHVDPVVGGVVDNSGVFRWSASPAGWERIADVDALSAQPAADDAAASAAAAEVSSTDAASSAAAAAASAAAVAVLPPTLDLPYAPSDGYRVLHSATGEQITWSAANGFWQRQDGSPFGILARFDGLAAGQPLDSAHEVDAWRTARDFAGAQSFQRTSAGNFFVGDGAGNVSAVAVNGLSLNLLVGAALIPSGASDWAGYIKTSPGATANGNPVLFRTNGVNSSGARINQSTGAIEIIDHIYGVTGGSPIVRQASAAIPGYNAANSYTLFVRFSGNEVTAYEPTSGFEIKAGSVLSSGHLAGIWSRTTATTFSELAIRPRDLTGYVTVGAMRFVGGRGIHHDPFGGLFNGLDRSDHALVVFGSESNQSGQTVTQNNGPGTIQLGRMERSTGAFTRLCQIDANADSTTTNRFTDIEGICIVEIGGVPHVVTVDRTSLANEPIWIYRCPNPNDLTVGNWPRGQLNLAAQQVMNTETIVPLDIGDGAVRVLVLYQGNPGIAGDGGILLLKYNGTGNPLLQASWSLIQLATLPGAWGLAGRATSARIVDLHGDGRRCLVLGSRVNGRNPNGLGGVFWIDLDEGGSPDAPNKTAHQIGVAGEDVTMVDYVDLGGGHGLDIGHATPAAGVVNHLTNPRNSATTPWTKTTVAMPATPDSANPGAWNLWNSGHKRNGRSVELVVMGGQTAGGLYAVSWTGAVYETLILQRMPVDHLFEKPFLFKFEMTNGRYWWCGGDDTGNMSRAFEFLQEWAKAPVTAPAAAVANEAESTALFAAMTVQPTAARKALIDKCIKRLKSSGAWAYLDVLYVPAAHDRQAARLNWKSPATLSLTENGAGLTWTADKGFTGDGVGAYLDTGYNPTAASLGYALNDAHLGVYSLTNTTSANPDLGAANDTARLRVATANSISYAVNRGAGQVTVITAGVNVVTAPMHVIASRGAANLTKLYVNGRQCDSSVLASATLATGFYLLRGGATYSPRQVGAAHVGRAFPTDAMAQEASLALQELLGAIGALG